MASLASFWLETRLPDDRTWSVADARLRSHPSLLDGALQRQIAVELVFDAGRPGDLAEAVARINEVLRSDNEFCDHFKEPLTAIRARFENARTTADLPYREPPRMN